VRKTAGAHGSAAWTLLLELLLAERGRIPAIAATLRLSPVQCHVLRLLEPGTPVSMRRVADALACDASNVTGIVDRLEARGLLERRVAAHDRRLRVVAVTRRGEAVRARLLARLSAPPPPIARLSRAEQRTLCTILRRALGATGRE
jgi:DNA-binding MarR family transcriptional regulator